MKLKKKKPKSVKTLIAKLDKIFSLFIRKRDKGQCYTCKTKKMIKKMDAGHYVKRQHYSLRYDERNVHCQCRACNRFKGGMMDEYAVHLQEDYGYGILEEFAKKKRELKQFSVPELEKLIKYYTDKFNQLNK